MLIRVTCMRRNVIWCSRTVVRVEMLRVEGLKTNGLKKINREKCDVGRTAGEGNEKREGWQVCYRNHLQFRPARSHQHLKYQDFALNPISTLVNVDPQTYVDER